MDVLRACVMSHLVSLSCSCEQVRAKGLKKALGVPDKGAKPTITASEQKEVRK